MTFYPLSPEDAANEDRDGDGLSLIDELFAFGTDPGLRDTDGDGVCDGDEVALGTDPLARDTDGDGFADGTDARPLEADAWTDADMDGLPDAWEEGWFGTNAAVSACGDANADGMSNLASLLAGVNPAAPPSDGFASHCGAAADRLVAWEIVPAAFSFQRPAGLTNVVTRTFRVKRASPWQQLYVSARPNGAAGWTAADVSVRYGVDGGPATNGVPSASADSWRLPLGPGPVTNLTFVVEAAGSAPALSRPLYLLRWSPHVELETDEAGRFLDVPEGKSPIFLSRRRMESGWYVVPFSASSADVPHAGGVDAEAAAELALPPCGGLSVTNVPARALLAPDPVWAELPPEGTNAAVRVCCWELAHETPGEIGSGPRASQFASPYPLSSPSLRRAFHRAKGIVADSSSPVKVAILPRHPLVGLYVSGAPTRSQPEPPACTNEPPHEVEVYPPGTVTPGFDGAHDAADACSISADTPDEGPESSPQEGDDGCGRSDADGDDCDCADDGDGTSQCSFRLRISFGSPTPGENEGFIWASLEEPAAITPAVFNVLGTDAVAATTNAVGEFTAVCSSPGGRTVEVANAEHGVAITVWNASGRLENRWEVTNPGGDTSRVRCRKLTIIGNAVSDETFVLGDDMLGSWGASVGSRVDGIIPDDRFSRTDETRGVTTVKLKWRAAPDEPDFVTDVRDVTLLADGTCAASAMSEYATVGAGSTARRRLARRYGRDETGDFDEKMDYWCDPENPYRHARLRSVRSNRRAWSFHDYDALGRETASVEQLDGSPFPDGLAEVSHLAELPQGCSAKATVTSYEPLAGDSCDRNDAFQPRRRDVWIMRSGKAPVLVGTETWLYTRTADADGVPLRTCVHSSGVGETLRSETTVVYPEDYGVPKELRGRTVSATGFDGVASSCQIERGTWDPSSCAFVPDVDGEFLRMTTRRMCGGIEQDTYSVEVEDALRRLTVFTATGLTGSDALVESVRSTYDDIDRLRSKTYSDGTSETNAYSCCRLLWKRDRQNRTTLRSAQTGTDHLYNAYEEIWLTNLTGNAAILAATGTTGVSPVDGYRITQHYYDALGRETNTVTYAGTTPGEAAVPIGEAALLPLQHTGASQLVATATTTYSYGSSPYSIHIDERGAETVTYTRYGSGYTGQDETVYTNYMPVLDTTIRNYHGGGSTTRRAWSWWNAWTEERRFTDYAPNGCRIDYVVTTSSDHPAVTNSVSTYDLLGRLVTVVTPTGITGVSPVGSGTTGTTGVPPVAGWLITSNAYDGATSRILTTTRYAPTLEPRTTTYLYNDWGEQVGTVLDGITNRTDTTYEQFSNEWWKVETSTVIGPSTNSLTITRTQLTGLSDSCRRHTITISGTQGDTPIGEAALSPLQVGTTTDTFTAYDPSTGIETETITSSISPTVIRRSLHGVLLSTETTGETTFNSYNAFARIALTSRTGCQPVQEGTPIGEAALLPLQSYTYSPAGDLLATHTYTNGTDAVTETYAYDLLGNRISTTDAHGNTIFRTYDPFGRVTAEWGATYPVLYAYDTQGRRTSLSTTRDGTTWDTTTWAYDPFTGNCTSRTYADSSTVTYTYTPDNLPLCTTYASGQWKENVYNEKREVVVVEYSDGEIVTFDYDDFSNEIVSSNGVASALSMRNDFGDVTNETTAAGNETKIISREYDEFRRLTKIDGTIYEYNSDGMLASVSNDIALVEYAYTPDLLDAGYSLTLSNGFVFSRSLVRDDFRRSLVTCIANSGGGATAGNLTYAYDALNRPTARNNDTFGYNERSEITAANVSGVPSTYGYDEIGNSTNWTANCLNQYSQFSHDLDGNILSDGTHDFTYDAAKRLNAVSTNGVIVLTNFYDAKSRRVRKVTSEATTTFFYDDWNLIEERVACTNGTTSTIRYYWGKDLSGGLQGAGGVGGLLYLTVNGTIYIPCYDNNGNITRYLDANGNTVAQYTYDAFGKLIAKSGPLADFFRHRFSTKYYDAETGLYYYGYRFYHPVLMRWLNRDLIEEDGGVNVYSFCANRGTWQYDSLGLWSATIESYGKKRRVYKKSAGDTMQTLADEVDLDVKEISKWAKVESGKIANLTHHIPLAQHNFNSCCYVSVPNVWIESDLLQGWHHAKDVVVNQGGTIGSFFANSLGRWGYYTEKPKTVLTLHQTIINDRTHIIGMTVYGHGNTDGRLYESSGKSISQLQIISAVKAGGYHIREANMMQCYSWTTINIKGVPIDFEQKWGDVAIHPFGYRGVNFCGIDFGGKP